jgi:hypothetical protein
MNRIAMLSKPNLPTNEALSKATIIPTMVLRTVESEYSSSECLPGFVNRVAYLDISRDQESNAQKM